MYCQEFLVWRVCASTAGNVPALSYGHRSSVPYIHLPIIIINETMISKYFRPDLKWLGILLSIEGISFIFIFAKFM